MVRCCDRHIDVHQAPPVEALEQVRIDEVDLQPWGPHGCLARPQLGWRQLLCLALGCDQT